IFVPSTYRSGSMGSIRMLQNPPHLIPRPIEDSQLPAVEYLQQTIGHYWKHLILCNAPISGEQGFLQAKSTKATLFAEWIGFGHAAMVFRSKRRDRFRLVEPDISIKLLRQDRLAIV